MCDESGERLSSYGKEEHGIGHDITGRLICPIDYNWDDLEWVAHSIRSLLLTSLCSIRTNLRDTAPGYDITSSVFLHCLYKDEDGDPEHPLDSFLKGPLLVQVSFRSISTSNNHWHYFVRHSSPYLLPPPLRLRVRSLLGGVMLPVFFAWTTTLRYDQLHTLQPRCIFYFLWFLDLSSWPFSHSPSSSFHSAWPKNGSVNTMAFTIWYFTTSLSTFSRILRMI